MNAPETDFEVPYLSQHAKARMAERGISVALLALVYREADVTFPGEQGCIQLMVSRPKLETMATSGVASDLLRDARDVAIVLHAAGDRVVTIYRVSHERRRDWGRVLARGPVSMLRNR